MKNQSQAGAKRPAKPTVNQPVNPAPTLPLRRLTDNKGETLLEDANGIFFLRRLVDEYFDGKKWREYTDPAPLRGLGMDVKNDDDPRLRCRIVQVYISQESACNWVLNHCVPETFASSFPPPLAGKYSALPDVEAAAARMHTTPDALVCHAVRAFLEFIDHRPAFAARLFSIGGEDIDYCEARKWEDDYIISRPLFSSLYKEAVALPLNQCVARLRALRGLVAPHPAYSEESEAISQILTSMGNLSTLPSTNGEAMAEVSAVAA